MFENSKSLFYSQGSFNIESSLIFKDDLYKISDYDIDESIFIDTNKDDVPGIQTLTTQSFENNGFISAESWDETITLSARILQITTSTISCECIIDKENKEFEIRNFPKNLFSHLNLDSTKFIIIKLKNKPGSMRIDIFNGDKIIDKSIFDTKDIWDDLENSGLDKPFQLIDG